MTPAGIEPVTFRFVAQHLNHCATAVPDKLWGWTNLALKGYRRLFPLGWSENFSTPSGSEIKNIWNSTSTRRAPSHSPAFSCRAQQQQQLQHVHLQCVWWTCSEECWLIWGNYGIVSADCVSPSWDLNQKPSIYVSGVLSAMLVCSGLPIKYICS